MAGAYGRAVLLLLGCSLPRLATGVVLQRESQPAAPWNVSVPSEATPQPDDESHDSSGPARPTADDVLRRMQYWAPGGEALPTNDRYVMFSIDIGGLNNIRIGWEMTGLVAQYTNRTLVLPPPSSMYLLDWGPRSLRYMTQGPPRHTTTRVEDLIDLKQLKSRLPTLTWEEFEAKTGLSWNAAVKEASGSADRNKDERCDLDVYARVEQRIIHMGGDQESMREGFLCGEWWAHGAPRAGMRGQMGEAGWALLQHAFVWHPDAFEVAARVVEYLGLFEYNAMHLRYNDFQFEHADSESVGARWGGVLSGKPVLYVATDEPDKVRNGININGLRLLMWDDLFDQGTTGGVLVDSKSKYSEERWFKLTGIVEELICTYATIFVGSYRSSFSGHIDRMRIETDAPVPLTLYTLNMVVEDVAPRIDQKLREWKPEQRFEHAVPANVGYEFLQVHASTTASNQE